MNRVEVGRERCTCCGLYAEVCAYNPIAVIQGKQGEKGRVLVFDNLCHGCGACSLPCPAHAIKEERLRIGVTEPGRSGSIAFTRGRLDVGRIMSPPLIRQVKERALEECGDTRADAGGGEDVLILDAP
jgi:MinD superfamily P-loop ATPase